MESEKNKKLKTKKKKKEIAQGWMGKVIAPHC